MSTLKVNNITDLGDDAIVTDGVAVSVPSGNAIINGDFGVWQRGTSFASATPSFYTADRWRAYYGDATATFTRSTDAPANFEYSFKAQRNSGSTTTSLITLNQRFENAGLQLAGKSATLSFWAKTGADFTGSFLAYFISSSDDSASLVYNGTGFMAGASPDYASDVETPTLTTTWTRYSFTFSVPSTANGSQVVFRYNPTGTAGADDSFYITGVQLEAGSVATPFRLAGGGSKAAELALCQRYYYRVTSQGGIETVASGWAQLTTRANFVAQFPVTMRTSPTALENGAVASDYSVIFKGSAVNATSLNFVDATQNSSRFQANVASGLTIGEALAFRLNSAGKYIAWSAEL